MRNKRKERRSAPLQNRFMHFNPDLIILICYIVGCRDRIILTIDYTPANSSFMMQVSTS